MKRIPWVVLGLGLLVASTAGAVPVNLGDGSWTVFPDASAPVAVAGNNVTLAESLDFGVISLFNDSFAVGSSDQALSFDYVVTLDGADPADTFQFFVDFSPVIEMTTSTAGTQHFVLDLTPYQNSTLSLEWRLTYGGDPNDLAASIVEVSNIDRAVPAAPVPEPGTLVLLGSGLLGLAQTARRKRPLSK